MASSYEIGESSGPKGSDDDFDIPLGFRFRPSDEDIMYYLRSKLSDPSQFHSHMPDVDIYACSPMELAVRHNFDAESEAYFFTPRSKKYPNGCRPDRSTQNGYWKPSGGKDVVAEGKAIGYVRTLKYFDSSSRPTEWLMKEYTIGKDSKTFYARVPVKIYRKRGANNNNACGHVGGQINATDELAEQDFAPIINHPAQMVEQDFAASQPIINHPAQMDSSPPQEFQSQAQYAPQFMGQAQSFSLAPESIQRVRPASQSSFTEFYDNHSAQMAPLPFQQLQSQAQCDPQYLEQAQSFIQMPQPIQVVEPTNQSVSYLFNDVGQVSLDPNSGPFHFNFDGQASIPQLETFDPEEAAAGVAPQQPDEQLLTDMNCLNTIDLQFNLDSLDYNFDFSDPLSLNQDLQFLGLEGV